MHFQHVLFKLGTEIPCSPTAGASGCFFFPVLQITTTVEHRLLYFSGELCLKECSLNVGMLERKAVSGLVGTSSNAQSAY